MLSASSSSQDGSSSALSTSLSGISLRHTASSASSGTSVYEDATSEELALEDSSSGTAAIEASNTPLATTPRKPVNGITNIAAESRKPLIKPSIPPRTNGGRPDVQSAFPPALPSRSISQRLMTPSTLLGEPSNLPAAAPNLPPRRMASPNITPSIPPIHPQSSKLMSQVFQSSDDVLLSNSLKRAKKLIPGPPSPKLRGRPNSSAETTRANSFVHPLDAPPSNLPPPPQRTFNVGDPLPARRDAPRQLPSSSDEGSESDSFRDERSSISPAATSSTSTLPLSIAGVAPPNTRLRTSDDFPDPSSSSRRPPFASNFVHRGQSMGFFAPHKGVSAVASDVLCVAKHDVAIYDLQTFREPSPDSSAYHTQRDVTTPASTLPAAASSLLKPSRLIHLKDLPGVQWRTDRPTITAMAFAPHGAEPSSGRPILDGRLLWLGTKDGQLVELDTYLGTVRATKGNIHKATIIHILRYDHVMVTLDETGKSATFSLSTSDSGLQIGEEPYLMKTEPRITRIADKQYFARILFGRLWTSEGASHGLNDAGPKSTPKINSGSTASLGNGGQAQPINSKGAVLRVYDLFSRPSGGRSLPSQPSVGPLGTAPPPVAAQAATRLMTETGIGYVTSATILMTQPGLVYVGHQGGFVTVWDVASTSPKTGTSSPTSTADESVPSSTPRLVQTLKISTSDIICMEAVHNRLWIGSRNGYITAHDVSCRPWKTTNSWRHSGVRKSADSAEETKLFSPVLQLLVDAAGIEKVSVLG